MTYANIAPTGVQRRLAYYCLGFTKEEGESYGAIYNNIMYYMIHITTIALAFASHLAVRVRAPGWVSYPS